MLTDSFDFDMFSVIIPTLNQEHGYLVEALECIERQTFLPHEILVVDNGDRELDLAFPCGNIKVIKAVFRAGVAQARNIGASFAKMPYLAFLDDDDLWATDYLEIMARRINFNEPDCLVARLDSLNDRNISPYKSAFGYLREDVIFVRNPGIIGSSLVVKRASFLKVGGFNSKLHTGEDKSLVLEMLRSKMNVIAVPECQAIYRQHNSPERLTASKNMRKGLQQFYSIYKDSMTVDQRLVNLIKIHKHNWESRKSLVSWILFLGTLVTHRLCRFIFRTR